MVQDAISTLSLLRDSLGQVIRGRDDTIKLVLTGLVSGGHVLIEDYPGSGKTTLAKTLGNSINCADSPVADAGIIPFRRIQFTPDLLPSDVLGVTIFDPKSAEFHFQRGPIFSHIVLADEINRTGPKVQAAFLECMAERQVTLDNVTYALDELFFVMGTQNPLDLAGTYPLPLVQLDRFVLKVPMSYVEFDTEIEILNDAAVIEEAAKNVSPVVSREAILGARTACEQVHISDSIIEAIVHIVQATRDNPMLQYGASTRAALMLKKSLTAYALNEGRDYVTEDDLKYLSRYVLMHRLKFHPGAGDPNEAFDELIAPHMERLITAKG